MDNNIKQIKQRGVLSAGSLLFQSGFSAILGFTAFFILTLIIFWIFKKSGFSRKELTKKTGQVLFLSFLNVGLWANVIFGYALTLSSEAIKFAPITKLLFGSNLAHLAWLGLPVVMLYWFERH